MTVKEFTILENIGNGRKKQNVRLHSQTDFSLHYKRKGVTIFHHEEDQDMMNDFTFI